MLLKHVPAVKGLVPHYTLNPQVRSGQCLFVFQDAEEAQCNENESLYTSSDDEEPTQPSALSLTHTSLASRRPAALKGLNIAGSSARKDVTPIALPSEPESDSVDQEKPKQRIYRHVERHLLVGCDISLCQNCMHGCSQVRYSQHCSR